MTSEASQSRSQPPAETQTASKKREAPRKQNSCVGCLSRNLPTYVYTPPVEAVVFGWGVAEDGQLGVDTDQDVKAPKVVEALLGTRFRGRNFGRLPLVAGSRNTLAIDADGQVLSWGWNARATLGHGYRATQRKPRRVAALKGINIVQAAIGGWHCLAVDDTHQAYAWGGNEYGQCGVESDPGTRDIVHPQPCLPGVRVVQVSAGGMHSCALTDSGEVWTWGEPWGEFSMKIDRHPRPVEGAKEIAKISCGAFHNLALTRNGQVWAWGINDFGQLGNGTTFYETSPTCVVDLEDVLIADIAAGGWHSLALTTDGEVYIWGRGEYGRLGLGDSRGTSKLRPHRVYMEGHRVVQASCGGTHTMALTDSGRLFVWGRASFGRLGIGSERDALTPVEVFLPGGPDRWHVISVTAGGRHSLVLALPDNSEPDSRSSTTPSRRVSVKGGRRSVTGDGRDRLHLDPLQEDDTSSQSSDVYGELAGSSEEDLEGASFPSEGVAPGSLMQALQVAERADDQRDRDLLPHGHHGSPGSLPPPLLAAADEEELGSQRSASLRAGEDPSMEHVPDGAGAEIGVTTPGRRAGPSVASRLTAEGLRDAIPNEEA